MPVGAIIGGVASIGGALIGSSAQKKAANKAADVSLQTAQQNNALAQNIYNQNAQALSPFQQRGNEAGNAINALLGLGVRQQQQPQYNAMTNYGGQFQGPGIMGGGPMFQTMAGDGIYSQGWQAQPLGQPTTPQADYNKAFQNYQNSTGYQFRLGEGIRAIDAGAPVRNSGATLKARQQYGQNIGSQEFGNYLGYLANQQGVGLSGASAQAGVGQNYVNTVSANNNSAGSAAANAALMKGQATSNMWGGVANGLGSIFGSSFGGSGINNSITNMFQQNPGIF